DARANEKRLPAAIPLAQQSFAHDQGVKWRNEGAYRQPVDRRRRDDREITHATQGELQCARDRCGREREHMNFRTQLLEPLLMADPEVLLFIDHKQAEILELDRLA